MEGWDGEFLVRGDLGFGMRWMDGVVRLEA